MRRSIYCLALALLATQSGCIPIGVKAQTQFALAPNPVSATPSGAYPTMVARAADTGATRNHIQIAP